MGREDQILCNKTEEGEGKRNMVRFKKWLVPDVNGTLSLLCSSRHRRRD